MLDEGLTVPDDGWSPLEDVEDEDDEDDVDDELEVAALAVAPEDEDAETPGIVSALTVPKMPTPATAAKAMAAVMVFSTDSALSRAWILASAVFVVPMVARVRSATQSSL